jgi:hypothetical protein
MLLIKKWCKDSWFFIKNQQFAPCFSLKNNQSRVDFIPVNGLFLTGFLPKIG